MGGLAWHLQIISIDICHHHPLSFKGITSPSRGLKTRHGPRSSLGPSVLVDCLSLFGEQHLHEERGVGRVALLVLEVEEVLAALRHHLQLWEQVQKLGEFVLQKQNIALALVL